MRNESVESAPDAIAQVCAAGLISLEEVSLAGGNGGRTRRNSRGDADPEQRAWLSGTFARQGLTVSDTNLDQMTMTWSKLEALVSMLPDLPVGVAPFRVPA